MHIADKLSTPITYSDVIIVLVGGLITYMIYKINKTVETYKATGALLKLKREAFELSIKECAEKIGCREQFIKMIEQGSLRGLSYFRQYNEFMMNVQLKKYTKVLSEINSAIESSENEQ